MTYILYSGCFLCSYNQHKLYCRFENRIPEDGSYFRFHIPGVLINDTTCIRLEYMYSLVQKAWNFSNIHMTTIRARQRVRRARLVPRWPHFTVDYICICSKTVFRNVLYSVWGNHWESTKSWWNKIDANWKFLIVFTKEPNFRLSEPTYQHSINGNFVVANLATTSHN